jgi:hypothetical protein
MSRPALRTLEAKELAPLLQNSLATGEPLAENGWQSDSHCVFPQGCCCTWLKDPRKLPDGGWLQ